MVPVELPAWVQGLAAILATAGTTWWLTLKERRDRKAEPKPSTIDGAATVVAATFTERGQMERLIVAMTTTEAAVRASTECMGDLVDLLKADAHRREVTAEVERTLRQKGVIER